MNIEYWLLIILQNMKKIERHYTIGIDVGGTNMKAVLFDGEEVVADYLLATPKDTLDHFMIMLNALIEPLQEKTRKDRLKIKGIGLSVAGPVDYQKQIILKAPNIPLLDGIKLGEQLENRINLPVKMDNDGNCFLKAEIKLGAAKKFNNVYGITIGTSIGSAWWFDNKIYRGQSGNACELAHTIINFTEPISLEQAHQKLTQNNPANLAEEAYRGDELAQKSYEEIGKILGLAFANIVNLISPEAIIIGGGVVESSDLFLSQIKKTMRTYIINPEAKKIKVVKGNLGENAGAIGAALLISV